MTASINPTRDTVSELAQSAEFRADLASIKARYGRRNLWPAEACRAEDAAQARYDNAYDELVASYNMEEES